MSWIVRTLRKSKKPTVVPEAIFKLDTKCFHAIFEWLPLDDLHSFGQTCKQFQRIAGEYFQIAYSSCEIRVESDGIYVYSPHSDSINSKKQVTNGIEVNHFTKFVEKITIRGNRKKKSDATFHFIEANDFDSLKQIQLVDIILTPSRVECLKKHLKHIEFLKVDSCVVEGKFYRHFLKLCKHLKRLNMCSGSDANWLLKKYPMLEHLELFQVGFSIDKLQTFFELNPNIQSFAIDVCCLWQNEKTLRTADIKLDDLAIDIHGWEQRMDAIHSLLNKFQNRGIYRRLHLYASYHDAESFQHISLLPKLEKLYLSNKVASAITLPPMNHLKELIFRHSTDILDIDYLSDKLDALERLRFIQAAFGEILPFVRQLANLHTIQIDEIQNQIEIEENFNFVYNLEAINQQRERLANAQKVTIFVDEVSFLAAKELNNTINLSKIELKRNESCEWNQHFVCAPQSQKSF